MLSLNGVDISNSITILNFEICIFSRQFPAEEATVRLAIAKIHFKSARDRACRRCAILLCNLMI